MRDLQEDPITKKELLETLGRFHKDVMEEDKIGDIRLLILIEVMRIVEDSDYIPSFFPKKHNM